MSRENTEFYFYSAGKNPYEEGTPAWNCYLDCSLSQSNGKVSIEKMIEDHNQTHKYYNRYLSELLEDGYLEKIGA